MNDLTIKAIYEAVGAILKDERTRITGEIEKDRLRVKGLFDSLTDARLKEADALRQEIGKTEARIISCEVALSKLKIPED